jgi:hypothetical protein
MLALFRLTGKPPSSVAPCRRHPDSVVRLDVDGFDQITEGAALPFQLPWLIGINRETTL